MPKPVVATIANGIHSPESYDPVKAQRMAQLPEYASFVPVESTAEVKMDVPKPSSAPRRRAADHTARASDKPPTP